MALQLNGSLCSPIIYYNLQQPSACSVGHPRFGEPMLQFDSAL